MQKRSPKYHSGWKKPLQQRSPGQSPRRGRERRPGAARPRAGVKAKPRCPRRGRRGKPRPPKKPHLGMEMQVHPRRRGAWFPVYTPRCHLRLRHHIPFRASEERGKFFLFWVSRALVEGSSSRPEIPTLTPTATSLDFCRGFGERLEITERKTCLMSGSTSAAWRTLNFPALPVPQFPHSEPTCYLWARHRLRFRCFQTDIRSNRFPRHTRRGLLRPLRPPARAVGCSRSPFEA